MSKQTAQIKDVLERLYRKYNRRRLIKPDPLQFVYHYSRPADMEIAAFLASGVAKENPGRERQRGKIPFAGLQKNRREYCPSVVEFL
jgi:hypothetical protein